MGVSQTQNQLTITDSKGRKMRHNELAAELP
jgi:hypothetical protein